MQFVKNLSLTYKIFFSSVILCFIALVIMGNINYYQASQRIKRFHQSEFNKKEQIVLKSFEYFISDSINLTPHKIEKKLREIAKINRLVLEFYDLENNLIASNLGVFEPKKLDQKIINYLKYNNNCNILSNENRKYTSSKIKIGNTYQGTLVIIYYKNKHLLNAEINQLVKQYIFLMLFLIFLSAFLAWIISFNLTKKIKEISQKLLQTDIISANDYLEYPYKDEIEPLVESYNTMLKKIENQKEIISKAEREETWKEMAKQVAHEINNPLTPMKLTVQSFKNKFNALDIEKNNQKVNELTEMLIQQIELISTISNSFTNFSKMPEKKDEYLEIVSITKSLLFIYSKNNVDFQYNQESIYIKFDKLFYIRIITNLIKNAIQATESVENPNISINIEDLNDKIKISIKDNGIGISKEFESKIFENNFTTKKTGLGIGLSMVKEIVEKYNGKIWFESIENKETTFYIEIINVL
jgi:two-component system nitrogen regulation sensor histidine kinase NtrY